jgi:hypothetical protein
MIAFARDNFAAIAATMRERFAAVGVRARTIEVEVDNFGRRIQ